MAGKRKNKGKRWSEAELAYIREYYPSANSTSSLERLAIVLGRETSAVVKAASLMRIRRGTVSRRPVKATAADVDRAVKMYRRGGVTWYGAGVVCKISPSTIARMRKMVMDGGRARPGELQQVDFEYQQQRALQQHPNYVTTTSTGPRYVDYAPPRDNTWWKRLVARARSFFGFYNPGGLSW